MLMCVQSDRLNTCRSDPEHLRRTVCFTTPSENPTIRSEVEMTGLKYYKGPTLFLICITALQNHYGLRLTWSLLTINPATIIQNVLFITIFLMFCVKLREGK